MRSLVIGGQRRRHWCRPACSELDANAAITVVLDHDFPNYSICGLPFFISGETPDWHTLAHRILFEGTTIHQRHRAERIDASTKHVEVSAGSVRKRIAYDRWVYPLNRCPKYVTM